MVWCLVGCVVWRLVECVVWCSVECVMWCDRRVCSFFGVTQCQVLYEYVGDHPPYITHPTPPILHHSFTTHPTPSIPHHLSHTTHPTPPTNRHPAREWHRPLPQTYTKASCQPRPSTRSGSVSAKRS